MKSIILLQVLKLASNVASPIELNLQVEKYPLLKVNESSCKPIFEKIQSANVRTLPEITTIIMKSKLSTNLKIEFCKFFADNWFKQNTTSYSWGPHLGINNSGWNNDSSERNMSPHYIPSTNNGRPNDWPSNEKVVLSPSDILIEEQRQKNVEELKEGAETALHELMILWESVEQSGVL